MNRPIGSIEIGSGNGLHAGLTVDTVVALERVVLKCAQAGTPFVFRTVDASTGQAISTIIAPSTPVKFGYRPEVVDYNLVQANETEFLRIVNEFADLTVKIPAE